ncbi:IS200/IS605 family transposase [Candidatus Woesearchaeota archaeon CG10_big_fil_rev_8_21_14_0_10_47_5]|nr:MAG: IS200/IS605 family transposase [Candidatus Woesearchaeota archaeon CG10_big_fil_rev_8_21_14_0_10_47_5]HII29812.1 IS200/IS605 family transposase [Candidatus Woesearchaeota archaeon]
MNSIYRQHTHNRSVGWSTWHLQWCTKYRYKVFYAEKHRLVCKVLLYEAAEKHGFVILDCDVGIDHIHVIASLPFTMAPVDAIQRLKGISAKGLFIEFPYLRRLYRKGRLWSPGKFIGSIGHITLEKAKQYLEAHHAKATLSGNPSS